MRFILIDRILELKPGSSIVAEKWVDPSEDYFRDHFPGFPVVPGVLLVEMMAQAGGKCLDAERHPRGKAMLAGIESAKFRRWVNPGETVTVRCTVRKSRDSFALAEGQVEVGKELAASAKLFFCFLPANRLAQDFRDELLDQFFEAGTV